MPSWLSHTFDRLTGTTLKLILLMAGFLALWGMLAPITTIVWWLNQTSSSLGFDAKEKEKPSLLKQSNLKAAPSKIDCYIIFLPGVGNFSPNEIADGEEYLIDQLAARHDNCVAVKDVFPYSVANQDLNNQNFLTPLWQAAKTSEYFPGQAFIQVRNLWRFAISADDRYGPVYNLGIARTIVARMHAAHPITRSDQPINLILISTSGGTQVALGATDHLHDWLDKARITVISIGGAFDGRAGFNSAEHVYHFYGDRDRVTDLPHVLFPTRWPWVIGSPVNQAQQQGRYTVCNSGDSEHTGTQGYFGEANLQKRGYANAFNNTSYLSQTLEEINQLPIWSLDQPLTSECPTQKVDAR